MLFKRKVPEDLMMRKGRVVINEDIIRRYPEDILAILANFVVVRAEYVYCHKAVEYQGYCHLFELCLEQFELPTYDFHITRNWRGKITTIEAIKQYGDKND